MAVGTSDGEYYPSSLEHVLAGLTTQGSTKEPKNSAMDVLREDNETPQPQPQPPAPPHGTEIASTGPDAINPVNQDRVDTTKAYDQIRDRNDQPGAPYQDIRRKTRVAQAGPGNKDSSPEYPEMPEAEWKSWLQGPPVELQYPRKPGQRGPNSDDIPKTFEVNPGVDGHLFRKDHPDIPGLDPTEYEIRSLPKYYDQRSPELLFIRKYGKPPLVGKADLPANAQPAQYTVGFSNQSAADKEMNLTPEESHLYDTHLRNLVGPGGIDNADGSRSTLKATTVEMDDKTYILPSVADGKVLEDTKDIVDNAKKVGLDKFPSYKTKEEAMSRYDQLHGYMEKDTQNYQEITGTYHKIVGLLDDLSDMKGAENWSPKQVIGYALSQAMNAMGFNRGPAPSPRTFKPANDNIPGMGKADAAMAMVENMSKAEFKAYQAEIEARFQANGGPSKYDQAVANQKAGKINPTGDTADEFIKSLREGSKPNLKLVTENPTQEPQGRPVPSNAQLDTQRAQQAAAGYKRDQNQHVTTEPVNVGQGKGVLNDNRTDVLKMIKEGGKPSDIADKFDITPLAVRNWIKRNGRMNDLKDILEKIKENKE